MKYPTVFLDTETTGLTAHDLPYLCCCVFRYSEPFKREEEATFDLRQEQDCWALSTKLNAFMAIKNAHIVGANTFFDLRMLCQKKIIAPDVLKWWKVHDVIRMGFSRFGVWQGLKDLAKGIGIEPKEKGDLYSLLRQNHKPNASDKWCITNAILEWDACVKYCRADVRMTIEVFATLGKETLKEHYRNALEGERLACRISVRGVAVDPVYAQEALTITERRDKELRWKFAQRYNGASIASPKQAGQALGLQKTDKETLKAKAETNSGCNLILQFRECETARKTLVECLGIETVYPCYSWGLATGRASTKSPNLQGFPGRLVMGFNLRGSVVPRKGYAFFKADYAQIEARIMAHVLQDADMLHCFKTGGDLHALHQNELSKGATKEKIVSMLRQSAEFAGVAWTDDMYDPAKGFAENEKAFHGGYWRGQTKRAVFGTGYGAGVPRLMAMGVTKEAAQAIIGLYRRRKARSKNYQRILADWRKTRTFKTLGGQPLKVDEEYMVIAYLCQGSAAEIMRDRGVVLSKALEPYKGFVLPFIHDECLVEVPAFGTPGTNVTDFEDWKKFWLDFLAEHLRVELSDVSIVAEPEYLGERWKK